MPQAAATADSLLKADLNLNSLIHTSMIGNMLKGLARNVPNNPNQPEVQNYYCAQTGGICLQPKPADFGNGLEQLLAQVSAQYSVGWKPAAADGAFHTIRVEFRNPAAYKDAVIKAQRGYYASSSKPLTQ